MSSVNHVPLVDLKKQYNGIKKEIRAALDGVFNTGQYILGENVQAFEKEFAHYCDAKFAVGVASGSDALFLALKALSLNNKAEVISTPNTFISAIDAIHYNKAEPIFIDVESDTYNIDVNLIEQKITKKTEAIIPVHIYGHPVDMDPILDASKQNDIYVIEDASHAHGSRYKGRKIGSMSDCTCYSFYPSKIHIS